MTSGESGRSVSVRLLDRLRVSGLSLPAGSVLRRVYPSISMRTNGAWSWYAAGPTGAELRIGSRHTMARVLAARTLVFIREDEFRAHSDTLVTFAGPGGECEEPGASLGNNGISFFDMHAASRHPGLRATPGERTRTW
jgi:hypothetical protein